MNWAKLSNEALAELRDLTAKYPLLITLLNLTNFDWSDSFDKNTEETQNKAQQVNQNEQELKIAEGDLVATKLKAEAKVREGEAARIAKWNGEYVSTNNYGPILVQTGAVLGH